MAGHSKWANIQHRKGAQDAKRGKLFTRLIRGITIAARSKGGDPNANPGLRLAIDKALAANMNKDTIDRAIKRGAGGLEGASLEEITYEGYGPAGVAVMVECMSDNRNRTVSEVRHVFNKCGGNLGTDGSVAYLFKKQGVISFPSGADEAQILECSLEAGAEDVVVNDDQSIDVVTQPDDFSNVKQALFDKQLQPEQAEVTMRAQTSVTLAKDDAEKMVRLLEMLEDLDDVQNVYSNANIPDDILAQL